MRASEAGTIVRLPDGREGTVVYNGLDGVGIKWGRHTLSQADLGGTGGLHVIGIHEEPAPADYKWFPEAMLRNQYPQASLPCVGEDFEIVNTQSANERSE